jgi:hypothetical protein
MSRPCSNLKGRPVCTRPGNIADTDSLVLVIDRLPNWSRRRRGDVAIDCADLLAVLITLDRDFGVDPVIDRLRLLDRSRRR